MAERIADNAEHIVDEMKRKARRRLVGAIVLALGAAIVLPLLLEKEPRPLGDDVSVQIPPVDESKFVNRLTGKSGDTKALPKAESKAGVPPAKAEVKPDASAAPAIAPAAGTSDTAAPKADVKPAPAIEPKSDPKPANPVANPAPVATPPAPPASTTIAAPTPMGATTAASASGTIGTTGVASSASAQGAAPAATPSKAEGFVVQLAAFADDKGANALANKLKKSGYAAFVQPVETSRGTLWRVRVGGYASRPEADAARIALKGEGYNGITAPAQ
jgi:DedD protein